MLLLGEVLAHHLLILHILVPQLLADLPQIRAGETLVEAGTGLSKVGEFAAGMRIDVGEFAAGMRTCWYSPINISHILLLGHKNH